MEMQSALSLLLYCSVKVRYINPLLLHIYFFKWYWSKNHKIDLYIYKQVDVWLVVVTGINVPEKVTQLSGGSLRWTETHSPFKCLTVMTRLASPSQSEEQGLLGGHLHCSAVSVVVEVRCRWILTRQGSDKLQRPCQTTLNPVACKSKNEFLPIQAINSYTIKMMSITGVGNRVWFFLGTNIYLTHYPYLSVHLIL